MEDVQGVWEADKRGINPNPWFLGPRKPPGGSVIKIRLKSNLE
jgi:hypothetical protein